MIAVPRWVIGLAAAAALLAAGTWLYAREIKQAEQRGYDAAVMAGKAQQAIDAGKALARERQIRADWAASDAKRNDQEKENAAALSAWRERAIAGTSGLRCPAVRAVQPSAAGAAGPVTGGPETDSGGAELMPDASAAVFSAAAGLARLVRKLDESNARYERCRVENNSGR